MLIQVAVSAHENPVYDLLVVGGGIQGVWVALEAARAGQSVVLLEREDFGAGTSANSLKILHGGLRYLQHLHFGRIRDSRRSVRSFRSVAGEQIEDLPFSLATKGWGVRSRFAMAAAFFLYAGCGLLWPDGGRNALRSRIRSVRKTDDLEPQLFPDGSVSGLATWYEALMQSSERVVWDVLEAAIEQGARCRNYAEAGQPNRDDDGVWRCPYTDLITGETGEVRSHSVIECTGPALEARIDAGLSLLRSVNLVFEGCLLGNRAFGLESTGDFRDAHAVVRTGKRLLFLVPHGACTIAGTWYDSRAPADLPFNEEDLKSWIAELQAVAPECGFSREKLLHVHCGWLPADEDSGEDSIPPQPAKESAVFVPEPGRVAVRTVKFTTAPEVARWALARLGLSPVPRLRQPGSQPEAFAWEELLWEEDGPDVETIRNAACREHVRKAGDALFRRSLVGGRQRVSDEALRRLVDRLGEALEWDVGRRETEWTALQSRYAWTGSGVKHV